MERLISLIIPCYNEEESIEPLYGSLVRLSDYMEDTYGVNFEFLLVNDGSRDHTLPILRELSKKDERLHYNILFSKFRQGGSNLRRFAKLFGGFCSSVGC